MSDPTECPRTNDHDPAMEINKRPTEDIIVDLTLWNSYDDDINFLNHESVSYVDQSHYCSIDTFGFGQEIIEKTEYDKLIRPDSALCPWRLQEKKQLTDK